MLDDLERIDWSRLTHAYGSADAVPGMIRALRSPDERTRVKAGRGLSATIFHQGTRFRTSAPALPLSFRPSAGAWRPSTRPTAPNSSTPC